MTENSVNPDSEILNAVRPGLSTTGGSLFLVSSPYARRGELWNAYDKNFGAAGDPAILVAQAESRTMNPSLPQSVVDRALERDPASAAAEYLAKFRTDVESFVSLESGRACVAANVIERVPQVGVAYVGFADPSGGQVDSMTLAIGHMEANRETIVVDCLREIRAPFSPEAAVSEFAQVLKTYHLTSVIGDKYASQWPVEQFSRFGILYEASAEPKSVLFGTLLAAINSKRVDLLDSPRLVGQLIGLERRTARGGKDSIDHAPGGHDDVANACAGVVATILSKGTYDIRGFVVEDEDDPDGAKAFRVARLLGHVQNSIFGGRVR